MEAKEGQRKGQENRIDLPQVGRPLEAWKASGVRSCVQQGEVAKHHLLT